MYVYMDDLLQQPNCRIGEGTDSLDRLAGIQTDFSVIGGHSPLDDHTPDEVYYVFPLSLTEAA